MPDVDLAATTDQFLARLLQRLPASLWDTDPASTTLQRDLCQAIAAQCAIWVEQREIVRRMTLLLEAEGVDLDTLLQDYGLRRYLQRPDPYARQVGMQILWTPKGTLYSVSILADLLFTDFPHRTLRTGRGEQHLLVADTHPITVRHSYWGLVSDEGLWYAVTIHSGVPTISAMPPPGLNGAPGPHTLHWFTVQDAVGARRYVSIAHDTLTLAETQPWGYGTAETFRVLDGEGSLWTLQADLNSQALIAVLETDSTGLGYWQVQDAAATVWGLSIENEVPTLAAPPPTGINQTPGIVPLDWFTLFDGASTPWYATVDNGTLALALVPPSGAGTAVPVQLLDSAATLWELIADAGDVAVRTLRLAQPDITVLSPGHVYEALQLLDSSAGSWWLSFHGGLPELSDIFPVGARDVTPAGGPFTWLRLYDTTGALWYGFPSTLGVWCTDTVSPGGLGTALPQHLGNEVGVQWHYGVTTTGVFGVNDAPHTTYDGLATALCVHDSAGVRWFWRVRNGVLEWSATLWPDAIAQSPWGELGWFQLQNMLGDVRYLFPSLTGVPTAASAPPAASPWGWRDPVTFLDAAGVRWRLVIDSGNVVTVAQTAAEDIPPLAHPLPLRDAVDAVALVQAAGSLVTVLMT